MDRNLFDRLIEEYMLRMRNIMAVLYFLKFNAELILTGSRFFGNYKAESNYDYFINSKGLKRQFLLNLLRLGFERVNNDEYYDGDPSVMFIYRFTGQNLQIDIQIIREDWFERKEYAQAKIKELFDAIPDVMFRLTKEQMKDMWQHFINFKAVEEAW